MTLRGGNQIIPPYISPFLHQLMIDSLLLDEHTLMLSWQDLGLSNPNTSRALGKSGRALVPKTTHVGQGHFSHQEETESLGSLSLDDPRFDGSRFDKSRLEASSPLANVKNVKALSSDGQQTRIDQHTDASLTHFSTQANDEKTGAHTEKLAQIRADFERSALAGKQKVGGAYQGVGEYVHKKAHVQLPSHFPLLPKLQSSPKRQSSQETYAWLRQIQDTQTQDMQTQADSAYAAQAASRVHRGLKSDIYSGADSQTDNSFYADLDSGSNSEVQADLNKLSILKKLESKIITRLNQSQSISSMPLTSLPKKTFYKRDEYQSSSLPEASDEKQKGQAASFVQKDFLSMHIPMHSALRSQSGSQVFQLLYQNLNDFLIKKMCHRGVKVQGEQIDEGEVKSVLKGLAQQVQTGLIKRLALDARWVAWPQQTKDPSISDNNFYNNLYNSLYNSIEDQGQSDLKAGAQKIPDETVIAYLVSSLREHLTRLMIEPRHLQDVQNKSLHQYLTQAVCQQADLSRLTEVLRQHLLQDNQWAMFGSCDDRHLQHQGEALAGLNTFERDFFNEDFIKAREEYQARLSILFDNMRMNKSKVAIALSKARAFSLLSDFLQELAQGAQGRTPELNRPLTGRFNHFSPWKDWLSSLSGVWRQRPSSIFPEGLDPMLLNLDAMERRFESSLDKHAFPHFYPYVHNRVNNIGSNLSPLAFIENRAPLPSKQALGLKTGLNSVTSGLLLKYLQTALTSLGKSGAGSSQYPQLHSNVNSSMLFDELGWIQNAKVLGDEFKPFKHELLLLNKALLRDSGIKKEAVGKWLIRRLHQFAKPESSVLPHWHNIQDASVNFNMVKKHFGLEREASVLPHWHNIHDANANLKMVEKYLGLERKASMASVLGEQNDGNASEEHSSTSAASLLNSLSISFSNSLSSNDTSPLLMANDDNPLSTSKNTVNGYRHKSHIQSEYHQLIKNHTRVPLTGEHYRERADLRSYEQVSDTDIKLKKDGKLSQAHDTNQENTDDGKPLQTKRAQLSFKTLTQGEPDFFLNTTDLNTSHLNTAYLNNTHLNTAYLNNTHLNNTHLNNTRPHGLSSSKTHLNTSYLNNRRPHGLSLSNTQLNIPFNTESCVSPSATSIRSLPTGKGKESALGAAKSSPVRLNVGRITYNRPAFSTLKAPVKKRPQPTMTLSDYNQRLRGQ
ncbi:hypothetical protein [uncultured Shewanella sp.]|uniref:hypothetical protein n=1 Tax=uncultured Shewanella sp. TaxID=173975 RepID=UPI00261463FD|nr:hypothetical protein [uncultured Shewanella sp.]